MSLKLLESILVGYLFRSVAKTPTLQKLSGFEPGTLGFESQHLTFLGKMARSLFGEKFE